MEWAARNGVGSMTYSMGKTRIRFDRSPVGGAAVAGPGQQPQDVPAAGQAASAEPAPQAENHVTAPIAGLCHLSNVDGERPGLTVGDEVDTGDTLCVIEAMKVMTGIPAPRAGRIREILVRDGDTVDVGTPLIELE